jgi:hypothetical protein
MDSNSANSLAKKCLERVRAEQRNSLTTAPLEPADGFEPEWLDFDGVRRCYSIGRSTCYTLIRDGEIRSVSLRRKGSARGRRLIDAASVREFLARQPNDVAPELSAHMRKARAFSHKRKLEPSR